MLYDYPRRYPIQVDRLDLDEMAEWCQVANTWLAAFQDQQQIVTRSISLRSLTAEQFETGRQNGKWHFRLSVDHFWRRKMVRLRSVALQVDSHRAEGSWNVSLSVPAAAVYLDSNGAERNLSQGHVGTLYLGRINERRFAVLPELQAAPRLQNCSPAGDWILEIRGPSTANTDARCIRDVDLHFTVSLI